MAASKSSHPDCFIGKYCYEHKFVHGGEAEELRERFEKLLEELAEYERREAPFVAGDARQSIQRVLDQVDARDSLAYLERRRGRPKKVSK